MVPPRGIRVNSRKSRLPPPGPSGLPSAIRHHPSSFSALQIRVHPWLKLPDKISVIIGKNGATRYHKKIISKNNHTTFRKTLIRVSPYAILPPVSARNRRQSG